MKRAVLPAEAGFTVAASLLHRQHRGVRGAGQQELSELERSGHAETSTFSRTLKPLQSADAARHRAVSGLSSLQIMDGQHLFLLRGV